MIQKKIHPFNLLNVPFRPVQPPPERVVAQRWASAAAAAAPGWPLGWPPAAGAARPTGGPPRLGPLGPLGTGPPWLLVPKLDRKKAGTSFG